tara:strand:- start:15277 stop:16959 length:1683 start_codon:yes stop_codon:yes gene_type:complete
MSWKKHFTVYGGQSADSMKPSSASRFQSWLPEVYSGQPNRVERYAQYDQMDMDSEINAAIDIISEFSTQVDEQTHLPFKINYRENATESESKILEQTLQQWCNLQDWDKRIFRMFRNTIKYGDQFFIRDPETWELYYVNPVDVMKAVVNEAKGKKPEQYIIKNIDLNMQEKTVSKPVQHSQTYGTVNSMMRGQVIDKGMYGQGAGQYDHGTGQIQEYTVDANHVVHLGLTEGMDGNWPFGSSILDPIFKTYKQKELLEDSIIIYRVQRAPERRVFYVDVGNMPPNKAMGFVERVKNEIHQKRIPNKTGGGTTIMDAAYNPLSIMEDYFFAQTSEGRGSKVEVLPGGENLGQIDDLRYFTNKMLRALRVPSSYLPTGPDDGTASYVDGRVGTAFIQEYRFNQYCMRLQASIAPTMDKEFKLFMKNKGINIDASVFDLEFVEPQSFSTYKEIEIHSARAAVFGNLEGVPYMSRRFILEKYLGWSEEEILKNERMWEEENQAGTTPEGSDIPGLGNVGVRGFDVPDGGDIDIPADAATGEETEGASPISGAETAPAPAGDENA